MKTNERLRLEEVFIRKVKNENVSSEDFERFFQNNFYNRYLILEELREAMRCPKCNSSNIHMVYQDEITKIGLLTSTDIVDRKYCCKDCNLEYSACITENQRKSYIVYYLLLAIAIILCILSLWVRMHLNMIGLVPIVLVLLSYGIIAGINLDERLDEINKSRRMDNFEKSIVEKIY